MQNVPWVDVDISESYGARQAVRLVLTRKIVLDPYLLNILPKSLVPIGIHLTIVAVAAWYLSKAIWSFLDRGSKPPVDPKQAASQQKKDT